MNKIKSYIYVTGQDTSGKPKLFITSFPFGLDERWKFLQETEIVLAYSNDELEQIGRDVAHSSLSEVDRLRKDNEELKTLIAEMCTDETDAEEL